MVECIELVFRDSEGRYLLQLRDTFLDIKNPNCWSLFGGTIEAGETPLYAALREAKEELNLELNENNLDLGLLARIGDDTCYFFRVKKLIALSDIILKEGADAKFYSREEMLNLENLVPWLREYLDRI